MKKRRPHGREYYYGGGDGAGILDRYGQRRRQESERKEICL